MKKKLFSSALLLVTAMVWGFAFVAQVKGMESVGTYTYNGLRFLIGSAVMLPLFLIFSKEKRDKKKLRSSILYGVPAGLLLFTASTLQQYAIELSPDANSMKAGFITGLYTVTGHRFRFYEKEYSRDDMDRSCGGAFRALSALCRGRERI